MNDMSPEKFSAAINERIKTIHQWALDKGWWEMGVENRDVAEIVVNFHGEVSEAWEEYRSGRMDLWWSCPVNKTPVDAGLVDSDGMLNSMAMGVMQKPEGFWVETGDLCIRIMDTMGAMDWKPEGLKQVVFAYEDNFPLFLHVLHEEIARMSDGQVWCGTAEYTASEMAWGIIVKCGITAKYNGVDLLELIDLKMAYNHTRRRRHGGKRA